MPNMRFRLDSIAVEGFKAFTSEQVIRVGGNHLFLFGDNGTGKSSVVEAIRWCLFGLAERPETEVRNVFYPLGECRVELVLSSRDRRLIVSRRLRPGTGKSDLEIKDASGTELPLKEVFPHLARIGPEEGAHIILASQQAAMRRPQADISEFDRVLYAYLGLQDVDDLARKLESVLEEERVQLEKVDDTLRTFEQMGRGKIAEIETKLEELIRNRPWGGGEAPTSKETEARVLTAVSELAGLRQTPVPTDVPLSDLLTLAEQWVSELDAAQVESLKSVIAGERQFLMALKQARGEYQGSREVLRGLTDETRNLQHDLAQISGSRSAEDLERAIADLTVRLQRESLRVEIASRAAEDVQEDTKSQCPVCLAVYSPDELADRVRQAGAEAARADAEARQLATNREELERKRQEVAQLTSRLQNLADRMRQEEASLLRSKAVIVNALNLREDAELQDADIDRGVESLEGKIARLEQQLGSVTALVDWWNTRLQNLRAELRYHDLRRERDRLLELLSQDMKPARDRFDELAEFLTSLDEISRKLDEEIKSDRGVSPAFP